LRIVAVRMTVHFDILTRRKLIQVPAGAPQARRRTHFTAHLQHLAVGVDGFEVKIRMRIDKFELLERPRPIGDLVHRESTEPVVGEPRRGEHECNGERKRRKREEPFVIH
jgi:hypothetical protein